MSSTITFSLGFSTKPLTKFLNADMREEHGVRQAVVVAVAAAAAAAIGCGI
uniref:Uncharacterized protein n=1 Tax=Aegilops tauschii TaxID=37682 RepID=M8BFG1_AEGTA